MTIWMTFNSTILNLSCIVQHYCSGSAERCPFRVLWTRYIIYEFSQERFSQLLRLLLRWVFRKWSKITPGDMDLSLASDSDSESTISTLFFLAWGVGEIHELAESSVCPRANSLLSSMRTTDNVLCTAIWMVVHVLLGSVRDRLLQSALEEVFNVFPFLIIETFNGICYRWYKLIQR